MKILFFIDIYWKIYEIKYILEDKISQGKILKLNININYVQRISCILYILYSTFYSTLLYTRTPNIYTYLHKYKYKFNINNFKQNKGCLLFLLIWLLPIANIHKTEVNAGKVFNLHPSKKYIYQKNFKYMFPDPRI